MTHRAILRILLAAFFAGGAILHFRATDALVSITPSWVPFPREVVLATGVLELILAAMLVFPKTRKAAGISLYRQSLISGGITRRGLRFSP
jgi:uncharacterized membrane protein